MTGSILGFVTWECLTENHGRVYVESLYVPEKFCANISPRTLQLLQSTDVKVVDCFITFYPDRPEKVLKRADSDNSEPLAPLILGNIRIKERRVPALLEVKTSLSTGNIITVFSEKSHNLYYRIRGKYIAFFIENDCCLSACGYPPGEHH